MFTPFYKNTFNHVSEIVLYTLSSFRHDVSLLILSMHAINVQQYQMCLLKSFLFYFACSSYMESLKTGNAGRTLFRLCGITTLFWIIQIFRVLFYFSFCKFTVTYTI